MASRFLAPFRQGNVAPRQTLDPLLALQRDMDRFFGSVVRSIADTDGDHALVPRIDVRETQDALEIDAELPGVAEQDVAVSVEDDALVIAGEARRERHEEKEGYRIAERQIGRFRRVIQLPFEPDPDKVEARLKDGVLTIKVPQPPATARARQISVKSDTSARPDEGSRKGDETEQARREPAPA